MTLQNVKCRANHISDSLYDLKFIGRILYRNMLALMMNSLNNEEMAV